MTWKRLSCRKSSWFILIWSKAIPSHLYIMTRIGLISDTHGYLDSAVFKHFKDCHEIWHAGDFGDILLAEQLSSQSGLPVKGVYGNIDGYDIRSVYPEVLQFVCEDIK